MRRLIDTQDAFNVLSDYYHHNSSAQHLALQEALNKVPTAYAEPHWIPVSERLPEALEEVLVTSKYGHVYTSRIVHGEFEYGGEVIAWMPLPKPYEVEE